LRDESPKTEGGEKGVESSAQTQWGIGYAALRKGPGEETKRTMGRNEKKNEAVKAKRPQEELQVSFHVGKSAGAVWGAYTNFKEEYALLERRKRGEGASAAARQYKEGIAENVAETRTIMTIKGELGRTWGVRKKTRGRRRTKTKRWEGTRSGKLSGGK